MPNDMIVFCLFVLFLIKLGILKYVSHIFLAAGVLGDGIGAFADVVPVDALP